MVVYGKYLIFSLESNQLNKNVLVMDNSISKISIMANLIFYWNGKFIFMSLEAQLYALSIYFIEVYRGLILVVWKVLAFH